MRADKAKITDEVWDDERIHSFLNKPALGQEPEQYSQLLFAYRSMRAEDFARFVHAFVEAGGDLNTQNKDGLSLHEVIASHAQAKEFLTILQQYS